MPQVFKIGSYWVYFWSNECNPLEPVHVHVAEGSPVENATKYGLHLQERFAYATTTLIFHL